MAEDQKHLSGEPDSVRPRRKRRSKADAPLDAEKAVGELTRDTELIDGRGKEGEELKDKLLKLYSDIEEGFIKQGDRADDQMDYWDAYNCILSGQQAYNGNAQIFVPLIHNAVNARATRFVNQLFPKGGRYVEVVSTDSEQPHAEVALLEHYVRKAKLRTEVAPAVCINGDIEGQYNLYVSWSTVARHVVWKKTAPLRVMGAELEGVGDTVETIEEDTILDEHPVVEVLADADVLILPVTCNSVSEALELGGSYTVIRRWTKGQIEEMRDAGEIVEEEADALLQAMAEASQDKPTQPNPPKKHADAAGIKAKGKVVLGYETWKKLEIDGERRLCKILFGGDKIVLSAKLCPYWSDRCPGISVPAKKVSGVVKGKSQVEPCVKMQYAANDAVNEGMDSATFALLPIIMTDPTKNPKTNTMILDLAAVWETSPKDTQFAQFPQLWQSAFEIVAACQSQIFQTLSVSPAMLPQSTGGKSKRNQAEIALEQQVDLLATADAVTILEEVFTEVLERFAEMDAQFRNDAITVRKFGHMGMRAAMDKVPPLQLGNRYSFLWYGVEQAKNAAMRQQQIALINVARGIPPQLLPGRKLDLVPALDAAFADVFSSRIAPYIFKDISKEFSYDPELENKILEEGHIWPISPLDDDAEHMKVHEQAQQETGDPKGTIRQHIAFHRMSQVGKAMAQQQQMMGSPGTPGGAGRGIAGQPRIGAQPGQPRPQGPPGMIAQDRMGAAGAVVPPRRA